MKLIFMVAYKETTLLFTVTVVTGHSLKCASVSLHTFPIFDRNSSNILVIQLQLRITLTLPDCYSLVMSLCYKIIATL